MIKKVRGFTLIEIIIGIVVLSIALTGGLSLLISQVDAYRDPLIKEKSVQIAKRVVHEIQIRAYDEKSVQIAKRMVHEIQIRAYDEKSDIGGGIFRCSETVGGISLVDCSAEYGTDRGELMLDTLDDVDDFDTAKLCQKLSKLSGSYSCSDNNYLPVVYFFSDAAKYNDYYAGFLVKIEVVPAQISGDADSAKKITVTVRQSDGLEIEYSFIKANI